MDKITIYTLILAACLIVNLLVAYYLWKDYYLTKVRNDLEKVFKR